MKKYKIYYRFFLLPCYVLILAIIPIFSTAQIDTIANSFNTKSNKNLNELGDLYCWEDATFYPGKFQFHSVENVKAKFEALNFSVFADYIDQTELYVRYLEDLPILQKQNLVRYFSFFENDFEAVFAKENLPVELKYFAPAFSMMNPTAASSDKRAGVWQMTHFQAVLNGLQINDLVDERFDINLSTRAAAKQIHQNIEQFNSSELAIAAYVLGNVKIRNTILLAEENGVRFIECLPKSFIENVALFQAMAIYLNENSFHPYKEPFAKNSVPDTVKINRQLHLTQIADVLGISLHQIQNLNPQFKFSIVPGDEKPYKIILPTGEWDDFVLWQDSIYNTYDSTLFQLITQKIEYPPSPNRQYAREPVKDLEIEGKTKIKYRLKTGDVLGIIAENYDVRVADLKYWNNIYNERKIQAGKNLDIFVDEDKTDYYLSLEAPEKKNTTTNSNPVEILTTSTIAVLENLNDAKKVEHTVKSGESPYVIAKQYKGVTPDQILEWNNIVDARKIQIGQKLIVYILNETR